MAKYELRLSNKDKSEGYRNKLFDVTAVRPYPWNWGLREIKEYLIVIVDVNKTFSEMVALYEDDIMVHTGTLEKVTRRSIIDLPKEEKAQYALFQKNTHKVPAAEITSAMPGINLLDVADDTKIYQPFKKKTELVKKFNGLNNNHLVLEKDCITSVGAIGDNDEVSINIDVNKNFVEKKF